MLTLKMLAAMGRFHRQNIDLRKRNTELEEKNIQLLKLLEEANNRNAELDKVLNQRING